MDDEHEGSQPPTGAARRGAMIALRKDLAPLVRAVLGKARQGWGQRPQFLTVYQVLDRLPETQRLDLIKNHGRGGKGEGGGGRTAIDVVSLVLSNELDGEVDVEYMDAGGVLFQIDDGPPVPSGNAVVALYRLSLT